MTQEILFFIVVFVLQFLIGILGVSLHRYVDRNFYFKDSPDWQLKPLTKKEYFLMGLFGWFTGPMGLFLSLCEYCSSMSSHEKRSELRQLKRLEKNHQIVATSFYIETNHEEAIITNKSPETKIVVLNLEKPELNKPKKLNRCDILDLE